MGSIQSLRSAALASRAKEDTNLQVSGYLGTVNKSLGSQITSIVDQLQGVITERTKAYNSLVSKIEKAVNGKQSIGEKGMDVVFSMLTQTLKIAGGGTPDYAGILATLGNVFGLRAEVSGAVYDYEKEISQLGYSFVTPASAGDPSLPPVNFTNAEPGAAGMVELRNALSPGYWKQVDINSGHKTYIGSLRKR